MQAAILAEAWFYALLLQLHRHEPVTRIMGFLHRSSILLCLSSFPVLNGNPIASGGFLSFAFVRFPFELPHPLLCSPIMKACMQTGCQRVIVFLDPAQSPVDVFCLPALLPGRARKLRNHAEWSLQR